MGVVYVHVYLMVVLRMRFGEPIFEWSLWVELGIVEVTGRLAFELAIVAEGLVECTCNSAGCHR